MSTAEFNADRLLQLAGAVCNNTASHDDIQELNAAMHADREARKLYIEYCWMHVELRLQFRARSAARRANRQIDSESAFAPSDYGRAARIAPLPAEPSVIPNHGIHASVGNLFSGWPAAYLVATVIVGVGMLVGAVMHVSQPRQMVQESDSLPSPLSPLPTTRMQFVGRITGMSDCQWSDLNTAVPGPVAVPLGRKYALSSGLMEITYDTGAKVILQGPCTYEVESNTGGFLSVGKLTARLEKKEEQRTKNEELSASRSSFLIPHSYFAVRTPTAIVTDLGTEFGVEVAQDGSTVSHVFRGSVQVQAVATDGQAEGNGHVLHENESAWVKKSGEKRAVASVPASMSFNFVREMSKKTVKTLDLVDVVAGGDGFSGRRGHGIDMTHGQPTDAWPTDPDVNIDGDGRYHRAVRLPFVDGVFVPDGRLGPVQIDSVGHTFDKCPETCSQTGGLIWAGGAIPAEKPFPIRTKMGAIDYAAPGHGLLFMGSNKGITFDLDAIRRANPGCKLTRFQAVAGNTEFHSENNGPRVVNADAWVLVDGKVRFRRREINGCSGIFPILLALGPEDHFLTLAATDGGNGLWWDWVMFGDPRLEMLSVENGADKSSSQ